MALMKCQTSVLRYCRARDILHSALFMSLSPAINIATFRSRGEGVRVTSYIWHSTDVRAE